MEDDLELLGEFIEEALEHLESIDAPLLKLEKNGQDEDAIASLFRSFHSVKGGASMFSMTEITTLAHKIENKLDDYRKNGDSITEKDIQCFLDGSDLLKLLFDESKNQIEISGKIDVSSYLDDINSIIDKLESGNSSAEKESQDLVSEVNLEALDEFIEEASESLDNIQNILIVLEKSNDHKENIDELFREVHTIKGASDYIGLTHVTSLTHKLENILDVYRKNGHSKIETPIIDILLSSVDCVRNFLSTPEGDTELIQSKNALEFALIEEFEKNNQSELSHMSDDTKSSKDTINSSVESIIDQQLKAIKLILGIYDFAEMKTSNPFKGIVRACKQINKVGRKTNHASLLQLSDELLSLIQSDLVYDLPKDTVKMEVQKFYDAISTLIIKEDKESLVPDGKDQIPVNIKKFQTSQVTKKSETKEEKSSGTLKIEQTLADNFTNLVGELIVSKNSLFHVKTDLSSSDDLIHKNALDQLTRLSNTISQLSNDLQYNVMKMRMVPVKSLFQKFPRMVRDLAKKVDKDIELELIGEDTEIDKTVAEKLVDPLVHMVRNSLDHGIETKEERAKSGKGATATIKMRALHEGNNIVIEILDDGRGIDPSKILQKALENGLVKEDEVDSLSKEEILNFIFAAGFSTAKEVTNISGRGVGMDVVGSNIKKLKGKTKIESELGKGSLFRLVLPLTVAVIDSLIVESANMAYALPLENIIETVKVKGGDIFNLMNQKAISLRNEVIPILPLSGFMLQEFKEVTINENTKYTIIILDINNEKMGLVVDGVDRNQEILVKPLPEQYSDNTLLGGASILGDGRTILIIDTNQIPKKFLSKRVAQ